jgi:hypothetical protein
MLKESSIQGQLRFKAVTIKGRSVMKHGTRGFQGSSQCTHTSQHTHTDRKYFGSVSRRCKIFCISTISIKIFCIRSSHMQKLILHFVQDLLHFNAPDQNPLDSIGFSVVGSCKMRVGGVEEHAGSSHPPASNANILDFDSLHQNLFHLTAS